MCDNFEFKNLKIKPKNFTKIDNTINSNIKNDKINIKTNSNFKTIYFLICIYCIIAFLYFPNPMYKAIAIGFSLIWIIIDITRSSIKENNIIYFISFIFNLSISSFIILSLYYSYNEYKKWKYQNSEKTIIDYYYKTFYL